jgi:poly(A) polymerase
MVVPRQPDETTQPAARLRGGALEVVARLRAAGFEALFAGGCVRDEALGVEPKDWDVATSARPDEVMALFERSIPVGVAFGVVRVVVRGHEYEVATFRADGDYADHRRPTSVSWASAREDVLRRDFTINGLLSDPFAEGGAKVVDFVGGLEDLRNGLIRAIGDPRLRFEEDYLRMIRAVRFAARFGFAIDPATFAAVVAMSSRIVDVSAERIGQEMERLLSEGGQGVGLDLLARTGLLPHVVPELADMALVPGPAAMDVDDFPAALTAAIERMQGLQRCEPSLGWALLLWDRRAAVEDIARRLRMSRAMTAAIAEIIDAGHTITRWGELRVSEQKRTLRLTHAAQALIAARQSGHREASEAAAAALTGWPEEALRPSPLINGRDLTALGYRPGPGFAVALTAVEDAQLEGRVADREAALALAVTVLTS